MEKREDNLEVTAPDAASLESTLASGTPVEYTVQEEKQVLRRIDWYLLPGLSVLYLLCFLDRT